MEIPGPLQSIVSPHRLFLIGFGLFFLATFAIFSGEQGGSNPQPIAFNHARHLESGMACTDCHAGVQTQARATLPTLATCMTCHETPLTESSEEEKIRALAAAGKELIWIQLSRVPPHVYFSHRRHVAVAKLDCATCHGPIEKATVPPRRPFQILTMDTCTQCHEKSRAGADCNDCHR